MTDPFDSGYLYYLAHQNSVAPLSTPQWSLEKWKGQQPFLGTK